MKLFILTKNVPNYFLLTAIKESKPQQQIVCGARGKSLLNIYLGVKTRASILPEDANVEISGVNKDGRHPLRYLDRQVDLSMKTCQVATQHSLET